MYFYKYQSVSPLSLMMLKRGEVYFASASELNDEHGTELDIYLMLQKMFGSDL